MDGLSTAIRAFLSRRLDATTTSSPGRTAALMIGFLAVVLGAVLLLFPATVGTEECGSLLNPQHGLDACKDEMRRRTVAGVAGVAGAGLFVFGLVRRDRIHNTPERPVIEQPHHGDSDQSQ